MSEWTAERHEVAWARCKPPANENEMDIWKTTKDDHLDLRDALAEIERLQKRVNSLEHIVFMQRAMMPVIESGPCESS